MFFFYVRHGDPIYHPDSLTPLGQEQAKALAKRFVTYGLDRIYASDSIRAMMTAQPTADLLKKEIIPCPWAHETLAGKDFFFNRQTPKAGWAFEIQDYVEKFNSPEVCALGKEWYKHPDFAGLTFESGVKRVDEGVDELFLELGFSHDRENNCFVKVKEAPERVALFAHQGFGMLFMSSVLDIPYPMYCTHFDISHTGMTVIHFDERHDRIYPRVLQVSNDAHLYREGIMAGYQNRYRF